ncbi:MAG: hypothetical protein MZU97_12685 [Bacillus subtilis]|nr:hypothetical protein [Bacillus subtilis]
MTFASSRQGELVPPFRRPLHAARRRVRRLHLELGPDGFREAVLEGVCRPLRRHAGVV